MHPQVQPGVRGISINARFLTDRQTDREQSQVCMQGLVHLHTDSLAPSRGELQAASITGTQILLSKCPQFHSWCRKTKAGSSEVCKVRKRFGAWVGLGARGVEKRGKSSQWPQLK